MSTTSTPHQPGLSILLTGGSGFMGRAIVHELLDPASPLPLRHLRLFDTAPYNGPEDARVEVIRGDVRDADRVAAACQGMDAVIHTAAIVDWGTHPPQEVYDVNVGGTENILKGCQKAGVKYLVFTSSLDAVYTGRPLRNIDESEPYPSHHANMYCRSKHLAEELVAQANGKATEGTGNSSPGVLHTVMLRPCDVYGPADPYHMGSLIDMAKGGFYVRLGNGEAVSQHVFVGNIAWAHLLALKGLIDGKEVAGKVYFITDSPPSNFFHFFDAIVEGSGYPIRPKNFRIPRGIAYAMGAMAEFVALLLRPVYRYNPKFSRFAVTYTCTDFTFTSARAERDFGFTPKYSHDEAMAATVRYFRKPSE
jgi:sterol-4alpha-carboxylate 3-dehydrogenase (decarboxylating)